ncbi:MULTISPECIES: excinuclease ABC subunit UvrA [unclassified Sporosarcina]|uniref:excinuclease ABC subunit UvrA n=1 Tax=unclassified Sporosarcina TaxID=2647733 RepID=UPI00203D5720|nr:MULTISPECIES: excinuclease ABC subunit UvrA [unclassified Sporosarcina]GKV66491.1 excinuclease ABC subunit A [Sporosarcina sp. NCCP-2331]GLB56768.1 excinuclease ABC subunit A [Sporosarcina sp. NCCP-2378]
MKETIVIKGARENNLKNISLTIPKYKLVVLTGPSGSGKSTLAMETLQRECQRQYMDSMGMITDAIDKPKVDFIEGLSPSISVGQHITNRNPRSTLGTVTDIYTFVRFIFARLGEQTCPSCSGSIPPSFAQADGLLEEDEALDYQAIDCPHCGEQVEKLDMVHFSFNKPEGACATCNGLGNVASINEAMVFNPELSLQDGGVASLKGVHRDIQTRILTATAKHYGFDFDPGQPLRDYGEVQRDLLYYGVESEAFQRHYPKTKPVKGTQFEGVIPSLWRRYKENEGSSKEKGGEFFHEELCPDCLGARLKKEVRLVRVAGATITDISEWSLDAVYEWTKGLQAALPSEGHHLLEPILHDMPTRLKRIIDVGLGYLSINRQMVTLSGGEAQRLRLATLLGSGLTGVLYILDEPTKGLHPRDTGGLIRVLQELRDLGNTVLVIEHDVEMMRAADHIIDIGPGAGVHGGTVVGEGNLEELMSSELSVTGAYLREQSLPAPARIRRKGIGQYIEIQEARIRNINIPFVSFPLGCLVSVTGVSGSGKSTLVFEILAQGSPQGHEYTGCKEIKGLEQIDDIVIFDQSPMGRAQRSNVATYTEVFTHLRKLFADLPEAKERKLTAKHFSFNTKGGRCETCQGLGVLSVDMDFLPDLEVKCHECKGKRFTDEVLQVQYKGFSISDLLNLSVEESLPILKEEKKIAGIIEMLCEVGLGYLQWGQSLKTVSGGEGQRIRLAKELSKPSKNHTLYLLDEPTAGLHPSDMKRLQILLNKLVDTGNTVIVVEHSLELMVESDWVIDIGPEGGTSGGELVAEGTPEQVAEVPESYTGKFLKQVLV